MSSRPAVRANADSDRVTAAADARPPRDVSATPTLFVGKLSTGVQVIYILTLLLLLALDLDVPRLTLALAVVCAFFTLLAAAAYAAVMLRGLLAGRRVPL